MALVARCILWPSSRLLARCVICVHALYCIARCIVLHYVSLAAFYYIARCIVLHYVSLAAFYYIARCIVLHYVSLAAFYYIARCIVWHWSHLLARYIICVHALYCIARCIVRSRRRSRSRKRQCKASKECGSGSALLDEPRLAFSLAALYGSLHCIVSRAALYVRRQALAAAGSDNARVPRKLAQA